MKPGTTFKEFMRQEKDDSELPSMDLTPVHKHFKEGELPHIDESPVGRIRLIRAFSKKYGPNYRAYSGVNEAIKHYDKEVRLMGLFKRNKEIMNG